MSDPRTFGQAVREARLAKGMSMGQLATSVERSTASVRRWERDEGVPAKSIIDNLVAVLDLSDDDVALIAGEPVDTTPPRSVPPTPAPPAWAPATPAPVTPAPATPAPARRTPAPATPQPDSGSLQATQAAGSRITDAGPAQETTPTGIRGWFAELYDPSNPWLGYLRAALTVVVLIALASILVWALAELSDAVGEIWDGMWAEEA
jgi:hypothetical protein